MKHIDIIDYYVFLIGSPIGIICAMFIIIPFILYKKCKKQPGDLILGLAISDLLLSFHLLATALWSEHGPFA